MSAPKKPRDRTLWRKSDREKEKLASAKEKLAAIEPGGSAKNPREVVSASLVEPRALAERCFACDGELLLVEHQAISIDDRPIRVVKLSCKTCAKARVMYFRVSSALSN